MADKKKDYMPTLSVALEQTGEAARIKEQIQERLVQSGWRDDLKAFAIEYWIGDWENNWINILTLVE